MTEISYIQKLLDKEANMANSGQDNDFRKIIHIEIKQLRGSISPDCWGEDDCSTNILMRCPWRIDCESGNE
jgi:hypothetical protein